MGRLEVSHAPATQQGFRKEQRAKEARAIINKTIPQVLGSDARARKGIARAELIVDPVRSEVNSAKLSNTSKKKQKNSENSEFQKDAPGSKGSSSKAAPESSEDSMAPINIRIQVKDTLIAARTLHQTSRSRKNVAILNMASPLRPGGGVLNGATSQEESLCVRTTLLISLKDKWYRLPEIGGIWAPDVIVFRLPGAEGDEELGKTERFYVDVISSAMIRFPDVVDKLNDKSGDADGEVEVEKVYADAKDRDLVLEKIRAVLHILQSHGAERVVLGAWGCGAYGNPTSEIARAWKKALLGSSRSSKVSAQSNIWAPLKEVIFAIKDPKMAREFAKFWGDEIEVEVSELKIRRQPEDDADARRVEELWEKIQTLELQIPQTKTLMMKEGLESTLLVLREQLASLSTDELPSDEGIEE